MENKFINYFSRITPLTPEESQGLADNMTVTNFKKNTILLEEGQASTDTYFILKGCIRQYTFIDGDEKTTNFYTEDQWVISLTGLTQNAPSDHNLICVEDTAVVAGNEQKAQELFKQFPRFETIARIVMEMAFAEQSRMLTSYLTDSPEQRYLKLLKSRPDIFQRIPQHQIASYIGVMPESLSRIRKRIIQKNN